MYKKIINKILQVFYIKSIKTKKNDVYLTFDDGPETGITEFVLDELKKYNYLATFFSRGDNAERNSLLMDRIRQEGHAVANHTYSHLHAYDVPAKYYLDDVEKADSVLHTNLFRPPHGSLTFKTWWNLRNKYKIVFWALNSEDSKLGNFDLQYAFTNLKKRTKPGDVILFHFCQKHEQETSQILPLYLAWLYEQGYNCNKID